MSIKYGTVCLKEYTQFSDRYGGYQLILTSLHNALGNNFPVFIFSNTIADTYKNNTVLGFPGLNYGIVVQGWPNHYFQQGFAGKGYFFVNLEHTVEQGCLTNDINENPCLSSFMQGSWTNPYSLHGRKGDVSDVGQGDDGAIKWGYCRYAVSDNGDWILSFTINENHNNNRYNYPGGSAYYIGTKIDGKDVIIDHNGEIWDNTTVNTKTDYSRLTRITPVYYDSKQTSQIALTDFLIKDSQYNIQTLDNIKLAITHRGGINPYLIKDDKGDEYCVVPASCPNESALVLKEVKR